MDSLKSILDNTQEGLFINALREDPCDTLVPEAGQDCTGCPYENLITETTTCFEARFANHLISKGAVIPPVDVGDKVWYIEGGYYNASYMRPREIEVTEINKKKSGKTIEWAFIASGTRYKFTSLGKSVFLNKKDCEAAIEKKKKQSGRRFT